MVRNWRMLLANTLTIGTVLIYPTKEVLAQNITTDGTLGTPQTLTGPNYEIPQSLGQTVNSNLFHSFGKFNLDSNEAAIFQSGNEINNIFSRVTGGSPSSINGLIQTLGQNVNLFFLNPSGIIFGPNASLDVSGSFLATTADSFVFGDGKEFSATNPQSAPLLTVNFTPGLQYGRNNPSGTIENQGNLTVGSQQRLTLAGNQVTSIGSLTAPGGRVELLGRESVALSENATIDVSSPTGGGTVLIGGDFQGRGTLPNAQRTYVGNNVTINADALTIGDGGRVIVWADEVTGFYGNISARGGVESGNGGLVEVSGKEHLIFRGNIDTSAVNGLPGTLLLDPKNIIIADGTGDEAGDGTDTFAGNNSGVEGSILSAPLSEIDDTAPTTIYESELEGLSGDTNIILQATNDIRLQDLSDDGLELATGEGIIALSADADGDGVGDFIMEDNVADTIFTNGRNIAISGANLMIGSIDTSLLVVGDAGELIETARFVSDSPGVTLKSISGNISNTEDVDLFQIYLTGEGTFSASTVNPETRLDTQLFLFDADGLGVYANEDQAGCNCFQATLPAGDALTPTEPGVYYLGISTFRDNAVSSGGEIFPSSSNAGFEAIRPPTGDGGLLPLSAWLGGSRQGSYRISLNGVEAAEATVVESIQPRGDSGSITFNATGDININGLVDTSGNLGDGGAVDITARSLLLTNSAQINSSIKGEGNAGVINIDTGSLSVTGGARVLARNDGGRGNAGSVTITAEDTVTIAGFPGNGDAIVGTDVAGGGIGNGNDLNITARSIEIKDEAIVAASIINGKGENGTPAQSGNITIEAKERVSISNNSFVFSEVGSNSVGNGGTINISAPIISLEGSSVITQIRRGGEGKAGGITIDTGSLSVTNGAQISASTFGLGDAGNMIINADAVSFDQSLAFSNVSSEAQGKGGDIQITTGSLSVINGAQLITGTAGQGNAGNVKINALNTVSLDGFNNQQPEAPSAIFTNVQSGAVGNGGNIEITAGSLLMTNGAQMNANTRGQGDAGSVNIDVHDTVSLDGVGSNGLSSAVFSSIGAGGEGKGGNIDIIADSLFITNGAGLVVSNLGRGDAGDVTIQARSIVSLDGVGSNGFPSAVFSSVAEDPSGSTENPIGDGGDIHITTDVLTVTNGARLAASALVGKGNTGMIVIEAHEVSFDGVGSDGPSGAFSAVGSAADGGGLGITITTESLFLNDGAVLSSRTIGQGDGGNIILNANTIKALRGGQVVTSSSSNGKAGNIILNVAESVIFTGSDPNFFERLAQFRENNVSEEEVVSGVSPNSGLFANTEGEEEAGNITITTPNLTIDRGASISALTEASGDGGTITVNAPQAVLLTDNSKLTVETSDAGKPGDITITTPKLTIGKDAEISATATATSTNQEEGGSITVNASNLDLTGKLGIFAETQGVAPAGTLNIQPDNNKPNLDIQFTDTAIISASTTASGQGGDINLTAPETINISGQGKIAVETTGSGNAGNINISAQQVDVSNQTQISASTSGTGSAGSISIIGTDFVNLDNSSISTAVNADAVVDIAAEPSNIKIKTSDLSLSNNSQVSANTAGVGNAGEINLQAKETISIENSTISSAIQTAGEGKAGIVEVQANQISLSGSQLSSSTAGEGDANSVIIEANQNLFLNNTTVESKVDTRAVGDGGDVSLKAPSISVTENSTLSTATDGKGNAGKVKIIADEDIVFNNSSASSAIQSEGEGTAGTVEVKANQIELNTSQLSSSTSGVGDANSVIIEAAENLSLNNTIVSTSTDGEGKAGTIIVKAKNFEASNGSQLRTATSSTFDAGNIFLEVSENISLTGENSGIFANTATGSQGIGGSIKTQNATPNRIVVEKGAAIAVDSQGTGQGGSIELTAENLTLNNGSITAETASSQGGNITLNVRDTLSFENSGEITATAGNNQNPGDGGNIFINADFILAFPTNNTYKITAEAFEGDGGNIEITTKGFFGREFVDISASSEFGLEGNVSINILEVNPARGLTKLPTDVIDASQQITQGCTPQESGRFVATGRGGLPLSPNEPLRGTAVITNWVDEPIEITGKVNNQLPKKLTEDQSNSKISEAQGWVINARGNVELVTKIPANPAMPINISCNTN